MYIYFLDHLAWTTLNSVIGLETPTLDHEQGNFDIWGFQFGAIIVLCSPVRLVCYCYVLSIHQFSLLLYPLAQDYEKARLQQGLHTCPLGGN